MTTCENDAKRSKDDERVLVLPTRALSGDLEFQGFSKDATRRVDELFNSSGLRFMRRGDAEYDFEYKQLIPYVLFECVDSQGRPSLFTYRRGGGQGEKRLVSKWSVGIGGHVNADDSASCDGASGAALFYEGVRREIAEEAIVEAPMTSFEIVGLVNDDSTEVGRVHLGVVMRARLEAPALWANESDILDAGFRDVQELLEWIDADPDAFESWSTIALTFLYRPE